MSKISTTLNTFGEFSNSGDPHWSASNKPFPTKYKTLSEVEKHELGNLKDLTDKLIDKTMTKQGKEVVKSPKHYHPRVSDEKMKYIIDRINKRGYIEVIDVIDAWNLDFPTGSAVKYELRLGEKDDEVTEIDKAIEYLNFKKEMILSERIKNN